MHVFSHHIFQYLKGYDAKISIFLTRKASNFVSRVVSSDQVFLQGVINDVVATLALTAFPSFPFLYSVFLLIPVAVSVCSL